MHNYIHYILSGEFESFPMACNQYLCDSLSYHIKKKQLTNINPKITAENLSSLSNSHTALSFLPFSFKGNPTHSQYEFA